MNDRMRRLLDQDQDDDQDISTTDQKQPNHKSNKPPVAQDRRQAQKEWGRAIAKYHRERAKYEQGPRKP